MSDLQIQDVLRQMRALTRSGVIEQPRHAAPEGLRGRGELERPDRPGFAATLVESLRHVNALQQNSNQLQRRFELGDGQTTLPQVMVAMSKSSIAFEAANQVRNRLLSAYQEIMSMPV